MPKIGEYALQLAESDQASLKQDLHELVDFFMPGIDGFKKSFFSSDGTEPEYSWDDENSRWDFKAAFVCEDHAPVEKLERKIKEFFNNNRGAWISRFTGKPWFDVNMPSHARTPVVIALVFARHFRGASLNEAIEQEWKILLDLKNHVRERVERYLIQGVHLKGMDHVALPDRVVLSEQTYKGIKWKWPIPVTVTLKRVSNDEFVDLVCELGTSNGAINISTVLEFRYEIPTPSCEDDDVRFAGMMTQKDINVQAETFIRSIELVTGAHVHMYHVGWDMPDHAFKLLGNFTTEKYPFRILDDTFTDPFILTQDAIDGIKITQNNLYTLKNNKKLNRIYSILDRCRLLLEQNSATLSSKFESKMTTLLAFTMYWSIFELLLQHQSNLRGDSAHKINNRRIYWMGRLYRPQDRDERESIIDFWRMIRGIRNKYLHGHPIEEIEKYIKERYPTLPVGLIIIVTRERILRTLLCAVYYQDKLEQFKAWFFDTDYWPYVPETMPDQGFFKKIIRAGTDSELGKEDKKLRTEDAEQAITFLWH